MPPRLSVVSVALPRLPGSWTSSSRASFPPSDARRYGQPGHYAAPAHPGMHSHYPHQPSHPPHYAGTHHYQAAAHGASGYGVGQAAPGAPPARIDPPTTAIQKNPSIATPTLRPGLAAQLGGHFRPGASQPMMAGAGYHAPAAPAAPPATAGVGGVTQGVGVSEASAPAEQRVSKQWPPSLKAFVERCFTMCRQHESKRAAVTDELRRVITDASARDALWTTDWDRHPLPRGDSRASAGGVAPSLGALAGGYAAPSQAPGGLAGFAAGGRLTSYASGSYGYGELSGDSDSEPAGYGKRTKVKLGNSLAKGGKKGKGKRKPTVHVGDEEDADGGTALTLAERSKRSKRAGRFGDGSTEGGGASAAAAAAARRERLKSMQLAVAAVDQTEEEREQTWDALTIKGTCQALEKSYFRLTSAPDPATVRPQPVLERALARLRGEAAGESYHYLTDQLKALRQDLTVQRVRNAFTAEVYEHHARVALRHGDLGEFNQCQTVLKTLYKEGVEGQEVEFLAYRIIYSAVTGVTGSNINTVLAKACTMRSEPAVAHALAVRSALAEDNAADWFRLLGAAPGLGRDLMDVKTEDVRFRHLTVVAKVFRPTVPVAHLAHVLGFSLARATAAAPGEDEDAIVTDDGVKAAGNEAPATGASTIDDDDDRPTSRVPPPKLAVVPRVVLPEPTLEEEEACAQWLLDHGATLVDVQSGDGGARKALDGKESAPNLFVPEDKNAVAHGDQTLDIEDFLTKNIG